ncbi:IgG receptor FcRn large subunit p51 isoform X4 [Orcinus orca]|uniref:IgG receptor FcRn large subunit p51 isoform X4 n=1 Tax=Orcinus orca TaxID=9733 RepID=UPI0014429613|nr:IgG receptor FcRn large subunit p51 isoform X4 [Orcinus orca]
MRVRRPQPWGLGLLLVLLPGTLSAGSDPSICGGVFSLSGCLSCSHLGTPAHLLSSPVSPAESHRSLLYHFTAVSAPASGTPAFWVSGWLGPQQYLSYNNLRAEAEPYGAWVWESQVSWYWEKETTDLRSKEKLFLEALQVLGEGGPYTLQGLLGCELGPDNVSVPVAKFALNGEEFMMFDPKMGTWDGDWPESQTISIKWTQQPEAVNKEKTFLLYSCPHRLLGHLERGRGNLEWKESPAKSSVPVVGIVIGFLLLMTVAAGGALLWRRMRKGLPDPWISFRGDDVGALLPTPGLSKEAES